MKSSKSKEVIVVSLTTWSARFNNIPIVLDSIFHQTVKPDHIVINVSVNEIIPESIDSYLRKHSVIVNRVEDTKVYKKLLPAFSLFPDACIINIDDDFLYPENMIEDFMSSHERHPEYPISGNRCYEKYVKCHCGCASLTMKKHFGKYLDLLDAEVIANCPSDDMVYTYLVLLNGKRYYQTKNEYFLNMTPVNPVKPYSNCNDKAIDVTWDYLRKRYGRIKGINGVRILANKIIDRLF